MTPSPVVRHYRERADSFYKAVQLLELDAAYGPAVGLLAVHSGIALADAVLVARAGSRSKADDHAAAVRALERLCAAHQLERSGIRHLSELLAKKTRFSYGEDEVRDEEFRWAKMRMISSNAIVLVFRRTTPRWSMTIVRVPASVTLRMVRPVPLNSAAKNAMPTISGTSPASNGDCGSVTRNGGRAGSPTRPSSSHR